jgi:predicted RNase H-like nuclease (RuvC/YqgF family)
MSHCSAVEAVENLVADKEQVETYKATVTESNALVKHLQNKVAELQEELNEERRNNKHLNKQLDDYAQTANANISKRSLNYYVESILERPITDKEWVHFLKTFNYDSSDLDKKIYAWITQNLSA